MDHPMLIYPPFSHVIRKKHRVPVRLLLANWFSPSARDWKRTLFWAKLLLAIAVLRGLSDVDKKLLSCDCTLLGLIGETCIISSEETPQCSHNKKMPFVLWQLLSWRVHDPVMLHMHHMAGMQACQSALSLRPRDEIEQTKSTGSAPYRASWSIVKRIHSDKPLNLDLTSRHTTLLAMSNGRHCLTIFISH